MTYQEIADKIERMRRFGRATGYQVSCEMLDRLSHPEEGQRIVHIAGTNGKGSTAVILAYILAAQGFRVGLFTSPHLVRFNERICILEAEENRMDAFDSAVADADWQKADTKGNSRQREDDRRRKRCAHRVIVRQIPDDDLRRLGEKILELPMELSPTMFDICLGMGLCYFREQACDIIILETGLGGKYDSTRASCAVPLLCLITSIGLDHTAILGNRLEEIAENKAGILRPGTRCVLGPMEEEASRVILRHCRQMDIPFWQVTENNAEDIFRVCGLTREDLALDGGYQLYNGACAILAAEILREMGVTGREVRRKMNRDGGSTSAAPVSVKQDKEAYCRALRRGLAQVSWPGRMERISYRNCQILIDGAHNPQGVDALVKSLRRRYPDTACVFIVGILADKDYDLMLERILPLAAEVVTVTVASDRALQKEKLAALVRSRGGCAHRADSISGALDLAADICKRRERQGIKSPLVLFGSLYFVGQVKEFVTDSGEESKAEAARGRKSDI